MNREHHTSSVRGRFSAAAGTYDEHAWIQGRVAEVLAAYLTGLRPGRILEVGCGTGVFTRLLAERFAESGILATDLSENMVREARRRLAGLGNVRWETADGLTFRPAERFHLIASNCSLHWIRPLEDGLKNLAGLLEEEGALAFSIMLEGTLQELHATRLLVAPAKPPLERLPAFPDVLQALGAAGLDTRRAEEKTFEVHASSSAEIIHVLRRQGLTGGLFSRGAAPLSRGEIQALRREYDARHSSPEGTIATYRVGFFLAGRRAP